MRIDKAKRVKGIEQENTRLIKLVSDLSIDNAILEETVRGNYYPGKEASSSWGSNGEAENIRAQSMSSI